MSELVVLVFFLIVTGAALLGWVADSRDSVDSRSTSWPAHPRAR